jgi:hypothetical protein
MELNLESLFGFSVVINLTVNIYANLIDLMKKPDTLIPETPPADNDLAQRNKELEALVKKLTRPGLLRAFWGRYKETVVSGVLFGLICAFVFTIGQRTMALYLLPTLPTIERAPQGGGAVPFQEWTPMSEDHSPSPYSSPPTNSTLEQEDSPSTNISEQPSLDSPQADSGQTNSVRPSRPPNRMIR